MSHCLIHIIRSVIRYIKHQLAPCIEFVMVDKLATDIVAAGVTMAGLALLVALFGLSWSNKRRVDFLERNWETQPGYWINSGDDDSPEGRYADKKRSPSEDLENQKRTKPNEEDRVRECILKFIKGDLLNLLKFSKIQNISVSLHSSEAINTGQLETLSRSTSTEASNALYTILVGDPSVSKLQKLSASLKEDTTHDSHQNMAKSIDEFLKTLDNNG